MVLSQMDYYIRANHSINAKEKYLSAPPGLRSSIQNKAGTHQLVLSALLGCPYRHFRS
jgi:hypothetical protein